MRLSAKYREAERDVRTLSLSVTTACGVPNEYEFYKSKDVLGRLVRHGACDKRVVRRNAVIKCLLPSVLVLRRILRRGCQPATYSLTNENNKTPKYLILLTDALFTAKAMSIPLQKKIK
ncbi:hypothetical protein ISCGN_012984 [Ixodes scapularis]